MYCFKIIHFLNKFAENTWNQTSFSYQPHHLNSMRNFNLCKPPSLNYPPKEQSKTINFNEFSMNPQWTICAFLSISLSYNILLKSTHTHTRRNISNEITTLELPYCESIQSRHNRRNNEKVNFCNNYTTTITWCVFMCVCVYVCVDYILHIKCVNFVLVLLSKVNARQLHAERNTWNNEKSSVQEFHNKNIYSKFRVIFGRYLISN